MNTSNFKILFIHGWTASPEADFYPPLSVELDKQGIDYAIPALPGGRYPQSKVWLQILHETLARNKKPLVIVGHSLGTRAALLLIEKYHLPVEHLFLIAAIANRIENGKRRGGVYSDFFMHKVDINEIKALVKHCYVLHSKDDHSILLEQGEEIAKDLGAELIVSKDRDHFSEPSNAPYIFSILKEKIGF
jgi:predicted alpha/beta hydrolase family esterase